MTANLKTTTFDYPKSNDRPSAKISSVFLFCAGFFAVLSLPLIPSAAKTPRVLDLISVVSIIIVLPSLLRLRVSPTVFLNGMLVMIAITLPLTFAIFTNDSDRIVIIARMIGAITAAIVVTRLAIETNQVSTLAIGTWTGAFSGVLIALGQANGNIYLLSLMPLDARVIYLFNEVRTSSIWGHANAASQVTMAGAAIIFLAWKKSDHQTTVPLLLYLSIAAGNYIAMESRAPVVVSLVVAIVITFTQKNIFSRIIGLTCIIALALILMFDPSFLLSERWTGSFSGQTTADQAVERVLSTFAGLMISFEEPLGHSHADRASRLMTEIGIGSSHNGFIFAALMLGPWSAIFLIATHLRMVIPKVGNPHIRPILYAVGSIYMMLTFEDSLLEPSIIFIIATLAIISMTEKDKLDV